MTRNPTTTPQPPASMQGFADILRLLPELPVPDLAAGSAALTAWTQQRHSLPESIQGLGDVMAWLSNWQGRFPASLNHPRLCLFAAHSPLAEAEFKAANAYITSLTGGVDPLCALASKVDCDLQLYELNLSLPVANPLLEAAMGEGECAGCIIYGMMSVQQGIDVIAPQAVGAGTQLTAALVAKSLGWDDLSAVWLQSYPQIDAEKTIAERAVSNLSMLEILRTVGGREIAAIIGTIIAARMGKVPVVLSGASGVMAAALLHKIDRRAVQHCLYIADAASAASTATLCRTVDLMQFSVAADEEADRNAKPLAFIALLQGALSALNV